MDLDDLANINSEWLQKQPKSPIFKSNAKLAQTGEHGAETQEVPSSRR